MSLSQDIVDQFVNTMKKDKNTKNEATVNGTYKKVGDKEYVQIDGSDILTPVESTVEAEDGERVQVQIKDHTATVTGNITSPAARTKSIQNLKDEVDEFGNTIQQLDNSITQQGNSIIQIENNIKQVNNDILQANNQINQQGNQIQQFDNTIKEQGDKIDSMNNTIAQHGNDIESMNNTIEQHNNKIEQNENNIKQQGNTIVQQGNTILEYGNKITSFDNDITILNSAFVIKDGVLTGLSEIIVNELETNTLNANYAKIDFSNIGIAAVEKLFTDSGIIKDLIVSDQHITGELVGVTLRGDLIQAGTLQADKLVVKGSDGLYYKLNVEAMGKDIVEQITNDEYGGDPTVFQDGLHGGSIIAHSITAEKIQVDDLVAFNATIGGFILTKNSIHSTAKDSVDNTNPGVYMDKTGQFAVGDSNNYIKFFLDSKDNTWKLNISALSIIMGHTSKTLEQYLNDMKKDIDNKTRITLKIESSKGNIFKNSYITNVLSVIIYIDNDIITDMNTLKEKLGNNIYLQWKYLDYDKEYYIPLEQNDKHISNNGFKFSINNEDIYNQRTYLCELIDTTDITEIYPSEILYPSDNIYPMKGE